MIILAVSWWPIKGDISGFWTNLCHILVSYIIYPTISRSIHRMVGFIIRFIIRILVGHIHFWYVQPTYLPSHCFDPYFFDDVLPFLDSTIKWFPPSASTYSNRGQFWLLMPNRWQMVGLWEVISLADRIYWSNPQSRERKVKSQESIRNGIISQSGNFQGARNEKQPDLGIPKFETCPIGSYQSFQVFSAEPFGGSHFRGCLQKLGIPHSISWGNHPILRQGDNISARAWGYDPSDHREHM